jgi:hypothetical protein
MTYESTSTPQPVDRQSVCIVAFLLAGLTPAVVVACVPPWGDIKLAIIGLVLLISFAHTLLFGLPLFLVLRSFSERAINWATSTFGGFAIGVLPLGLYWWPWLVAEPVAPINPLMMTPEYPPAAERWQFVLAVLAVTGGLGATSGFVFWYVMRRYGGLRQANNTNHSAETS